MTILEPFFRFTTAISASKDITIHMVFRIYNELFDHIELLTTRLRRKRVPWKKQMLQALDNAQQKLQVYYSKINEDSLGNLFVFGTMLAPQIKLQYF